MTEVNAMTEVHKTIEAMIYEFLKNEGEKDSKRIEYTIAKQIDIEKAENPDKFIGSNACKDDIPLVLSTMVEDGKLMKRTVVVYRIKED